MGFKVKLKGTYRTPYYEDETDYNSVDEYKKITHYCERLKECGPFDLDFFLGGGVSYLGAITPCHYPEYDEKEAVDKCVLHAIDFAKNEKRMKLVDPKVVNVNSQSDCGIMFYITFDAEDKMSGKRHLYEAKVLYGIGEYHGGKDIHVRILRMKKKSQNKSM